MSIIFDHKDIGRRLRREAEPKFHADAVVPANVPGVAVAVAPVVEGGVMVSDICTTDLSTVGTVAFTPYSGLVPYASGTTTSRSLGGGYVNGANTTRTAKPVDISVWQDWRSAMAKFLASSPALYSIAVAKVVEGDPVRISTDSIVMGPNGECV